MENWRKRWEQLTEDVAIEGYLPNGEMASDSDIEDFISEELDKAREEGKKKLVKEIRESIKENIKIDDTEEKHIKIDTDIVKILNDKEITKMFLDGEEGEDIDWDCYGGWGWYS